MKVYRLDRSDRRLVQGQHFVKGAPLSFRAQLEAAWAANPRMGVVEAAKLTGASRSVTMTVARRLRDAGKLPPVQRGVRR